MSYSSVIPPACHGGTAPDTIEHSRSISIVLLRASPAKPNPWSRRERAGEGRIAFFAFGRPDRWALCAAATASGCAISPG